MKKFLLLGLIVFSLTVQAQVFPFSEGFGTTSSNTLPNGWTGDMRVLSYHGINDDKAMTSDMSSVDVNDTAQTPWIGPLNNNTEIFFFYRIVDEFIYPSTEKHYTGSDFLKVQLTTDEVNYTDLFILDSSNQIATLNFKKQSLYLTTYGGQNIKLRFLTQYNAGSSYFVDIDSVRARVGTNPNGTEEQHEAAFSLFPNPCNTSCQIRLADFTTAKKYQVTLFDALGNALMVEALNTSNFELQTFNLPSGVYFLQLQTTEAILTRKLLITR